MNVQQKQKQKGFTIIEVVLVLAIAGLIFLMVFIALPALQRSQRDTQRRDDISRFVSQLTSFSTNNRGSLPSYAKVSQTGADGFLQSYMKSDQGEFDDPSSGDAYTITSSEPSVGQIQYVPGSQCNGEDVVSGGGNRQAAIRTKLEGSGYFCKSAK
jgi:prepilin-type N-terminal cleavage/methylation domain-containing protein